MTKKRKANLITGSLFCGSCHNRNDQEKEKPVLFGNRLILYSMVSFFDESAEYLILHNLEHTLKLCA